MWLTCFVHLRIPKSINWTGLIKTNQNCFYKINETGPNQKIQWMTSDREPEFKQYSTIVHRLHFSTSSVLAHLAQREVGKAAGLCCCYLIQSAEDDVKADQTAWRGETGKHRLPRRIQKCLSNVGAVSKAQSPLNTSTTALCATQSVLWLWHIVLETQVSHLTDKDTTFVYTDLFECILVIYVNTKNRKP